MATQNAACAGNLGKLIFRFALIFVALACLMSVATAVQAAKRVALVIGNSAYRQAAELANPRFDADDMSVAFRGLGFEVVDGRDLDKSGMDRIVRQFAAKLTDAEVGAFFYAGHGLQVGGVNYLVPVDAKLDSPHALDFEMLRLDLVQRVMETATQTNVIFLDACRDNPLLRNLARSLGTRSASIGKGLGQAEAGIGTLISYATQPGNVALDGDERNSPYTAALKKHIGRPGEHLGDILIRVRNDVIGATAARQVPWDQSALRAKLFLSAPPQAAGTAPASQGRASPASNPDALFWSSIQQSRSAADFEDYIKRFPNGIFSSLAKRRLTMLQEKAHPPSVVPRPPLPQPSQSRSLSGAQWYADLRQWLDGDGPFVDAPASRSVGGISRRRTLKIQSAFGSNLPLLGTELDDFRKELLSISGGKIEFKFHDPGALVPAFEAVGAAGKGSIDGAWTSAGYSAGKEIAFNLLTGSMPFGLRPDQLAGWLKHEAPGFYDELYGKLGVKAMPCLMQGPEGGGWFRKPINSPDDWKGLNMRFFGLAAKTMQKVGTNTILLPGGEIYPVLESGIIDATEFSAPYIDVKLGFYQVAKIYHYPAWHQPAATADLVFGLKLWRSLSRPEQTAIETACFSTLARTANGIRQRQRDGLAQLREKGVKPLAFPPAVLDALERASREVHEEEAAKSPAFRRIYDSYMSYRR